MATYITRQRKVLLDFLSSHPHEIFSVSTISENIGRREIGKSSIYRNLAELENMGMIRRVRKSGTRETYYQYTKATCCENRIHLFCTKCEKSFHLNEERVNHLNNLILRDEDFIVDKGNTIIYGICKNCK